MLQESPADGLSRKDKFMQQKQGSYRFLDPMNSRLFPDFFQNKNLSRLEVIK